MFVLPLLKKNMNLQNIFSGVAAMMMLALFLTWGTKTVIDNDGADDGVDGVDGVDWLIDDVDCWWWR